MFGNMIKFNSLPEAIRFRKSENPQSYFDEAFWKEEVRVFCTDISASLQFIRTEITDEEFWLLTEVCDDILEATHDQTIAEAFMDRAARIADGEWKTDALSCIAEAIGQSGL